MFTKINQKCKMKFFMRNCNNKIIANFLLDQDYIGSSQCKSHK